MKFIKHGLRIFIKNPLLFFSEKKRNINFHFDLMHGEKNLNKAIDLLDEKNKDDFRKFVNTEVSFNPQNMFICKSKKQLKSYSKLESSKTKPFSIVEIRDNFYNNSKRTMVLYSDKIYIKGKVGGISKKSNGIYSIRLLGEKKHYIFF